MSVHYSKSELVELAVMEYCLGIGLSFDVAAATVKQIKKKGEHPSFAKISNGELTIEVSTAEL